MIINIPFTSCGVLTKNVKRYERIYCFQSIIFFFNLKKKKKKYIYIYIV